MDIAEVIKNRRSIRKYKDTPVEEEKIRQILESGRLAPSANNSQPWHYILVQDEKNREKLYQIAHQQKFILEAPLSIIVTADIGRRIKGREVGDPFAPENMVHLLKVVRDSGITIEHMVLQAHALGLGTCWVGMFEQDEIKKAFSIPPHHYVASFITVGYPDEAPPPKKRMQLEEILHYETFGRQKAKE